MNPETDAMVRLSVVKGEIEKLGFKIVARTTDPEQNVYFDYLTVEPLPKVRDPWRTAPKSSNARSKRSLRR